MVNENRGTCKPLRAAIEVVTNAVKITSLCLSCSSRDKSGYHPPQDDAASIMHVSRNVNAYMTIYFRKNMPVYALSVDVSFYLEVSRRYMEKVKSDICEL